jgi:hypothetical protein
MEKGDTMGSRKTLALVLVAASLVAGVCWYNSRVREPAATQAQPPERPAVAVQDSSPQPPPALARTAPLVRPGDQPVAAATPARPVYSTNTLERLAQIRELFSSLADGDRTNALRASKLMTNATDREAALLTLVTAWRQGVLSPPEQRARAIAEHGLEAGLGIELAKSDPALALLWADELTDATNRPAVLQQAARTLLLSDPSAAFALSAQIPEADQGNFSKDLFAIWASVDTEAALQWANQLPDPLNRDAALDAIHSTAPVGIGTALKMQDGYPVITDLMPGAAAESGGQLHVGDRIVALAQGDNQFVNVQNLQLQDVVAAIRGQPNTVLQLQVIPANADPGTPPTTIVITRDQIKFKH